MSKRKIAFDVDDVLAESTESWRVYINELAGVSIESERFKLPGDYWGYYENAWKEHGIDHLISVAQLDAVLEKDQSHIRAYEGATEVLRALGERFELVVITARSSEQEPMTRHWLDENFPDLFREIEFANGQEGIARRNKGDICKEIGADWLVDGNPNHCRDAGGVGIVPLLFGEYGWQHTAPADMVRCRDWFAVKEYFDGIG